MSNCIEIHSNRVVFTPDEFDVERFLEEKARHGDHKGTPNSDDPFCWFLNRNSTPLSDGDLEIRFGKGASSHTWRDFKWVLNYLKDFTKKPKTHHFEIADEYDDFDTVGRVTVDFQKGAASL